MRYEDVEWTNLAQDRFQYKADVKTVRNVQVT
jgi:hypothetical protein